MSDGVLLASITAAGSSQSVLLSLIASVILVSLRAWSRSSRALLTKATVFLLDGAITVFVLLFLGLVVLRFKNLA